MTGAHATPNEPRAVDSEPVSIAEVVRTVLALIVGAGWLAIPAPVINWIVTGVALLLSWLLSRQARGKVTPVVTPGNHGSPAGSDPRSL